MGLDQDAINTCMSRAYFAPYRDRSDVRCYKHAILGWIIRVADKYITEGEKEFSLESVIFLAEELGIEITRLNLEEILYIGALQKLAHRKPEVLKKHKNKY